jgi:hypothetical protein
MAVWIIATAVSGSRSSPRARRRERDPQAPVACVPRPCCERPGMGAIRPGQGQPWPGRHGRRLDHRPCAHRVMQVGRVDVGQEDRARRLHQAVPLALERLLGGIEAWARSSRARGPRRRCIDHGNARLSIPPVLLAGMPVQPIVPSLRRRVRCPCTIGPVRGADITPRDRFAMAEKGVAASAMRSRSGPTGRWPRPSPGAATSGGRPRRQGGGRSGSKAAHPASRRSERHGRSGMTLSSDDRPDQRTRWPPGDFADGQSGG